MHKQTKLFAAFALLPIMALGGCELIASVDHTKIKGTGGSSSSSTASASTATGCALGAMSCATPADCSATLPSDCVTAACDGSCCGTSPKAANTPCNTNGGKLCDGSGKCVGCVMPTDCPVQLSACKTNACNGGACGTTNAAAETGCTDNGGKVCDGNGACVACVMAGDCAPQTTVCKTNTCSGSACATMNAPKGLACTDSGGVVCDGNGACVAMHCTDGVQDADETDLDCGGASCAPCADTKKCKLGADCASKVCDGTMHCAVPTCTDGVQNGNETDRDCGGPGYMGGAPCPKCADKLHCAANTDCVNDVCFGSAPGTCVSCADGVKDGNETGTDCGGVLCDSLGKTCPAGMGCGSASDCTGAAMCAVNLFTAASTCNASSICVAGAQTNCATSGQVCNAAKGCVQCNGSGDCATSSCNGATFTPAATCSASNSCVAGSPQNCATSSQVCNAGKGCVQCNATGDCPAASCNGTTFTSAASCNGSNSCVAGTPTVCTGATPACNAPIGCVQCNVLTDCPATGNECILRTCTNHTCGTQNAPNGTPFSMQTAGDCQKIVCNGAGGIMSVDDPTDLPGAPNTVCKMNPACSGSPLAPSYTNAPTGMNCTADNKPPNQVCGDTSQPAFAGTCVQCNTDPDCLATNDAGVLTCSASHTCQ